MEKNMNHAGILLAAARSGSGKTTITCALLATLKKRSVRVRSFKSGPDYIDPMFHKKVIRVPSRNLDTFFSDENQIRSLYAYRQDDYDFSVIEGAMGLYDGLGGTAPEGSAYHLAQTLDLPVVLILDAHGMGRTMVALLAGLLRYDVDNRIMGVILNRTTEHFYETICPLIETQIGLPVLGFFPEQKEIQLDSRYLGLKLPNEIEGLQHQVSEAAEVLEETVDVERILDLAQRWALLRGFHTHGDRSQEEGDRLQVKMIAGKKQPRVALARDRAFCFYYEDNLRMLRKAGVELVEFSPLADEKLPEDIDGLILGGGYPELCAKELSENVSMREAIREAISAGLPSIAECGGFMYLHESLTDENGTTYPMAGVVPGGCRNSGKLVRFGYVEISEQEPHFLGGTAIRGHEFHYYDSDSNGDDCVAVKPTSGKNWACIHAGEHHWWGYPHLYYPSNPAFVNHFLEIISD